MKVDLDVPEKAHSYSLNIDNDTTVYSNSDSHQVHNTRTQNGFKLDISGTVMDNNAYGGHGRTTEDVMLEAGEQDIASRRNYMAIMSNTMSREDFAKLQQDGARPGDLEVDTVVTIVDHIKAAMIQGGAEVIGYTDDLDVKKAEKITGNAALARELAGHLAAKDTPLTEENAKEAGKAWEKAQDLKKLTEGAVKFLVDNKLPPTIENIYLAQFSGGSNPDRQGKGYFAQDQRSNLRGGYYAQKAEEYNWKSLEPQMKQVIEEAGFEFNEETLRDGQWLVEKGIPLTAESFSTLQEIRDIKLPQSVEEIAAAVASAIADNKQPLAANIQDPRSNLEKAVDYVKAVNEIAEPAADLVVANNQTVNLKNLQKADRQLKQEAGQDSRPNASQPLILPENLTPAALTARRQLEEIRLIMTVEANLRLLRKGISIETEPLVRLVDQLREAEMAIKMQFTGISNREDAAYAYSLYQETVTKVGELGSMPAALIGTMTSAGGGGQTTLGALHETGTAMQQEMDKADSNYETVKTEPRKDMGDSIQKAFRHIDGLLEERGLPVTDDNRRAVRILGYNSMEISEENIAAVKEKDILVRDIIDKMKPGAVMEMIREKVNPLRMSLEELQNYLTEQHTKNPSIADEVEDYSRFLYKLERNKDINISERSAYIGVYRLFHQIEEGDNAIIGAMINANMKFTMGNMITAVRNNKHLGKEYIVDDNFGGVSAKGDGPQDLKSAMAEVTDSPEADAELAEEDLKEVRSIKNTEDAVIRALQDCRQPVTVNNLLAAESLMNRPNMLFRKAKKCAEDNGKEDELKEAVENMTEQFTDEVSAKDAFAQLQETITDVFTASAFDAQAKTVDVKELSRMCRQISLAGNFAREEQYEVPVDIDGELTAINLRILHNVKEGGKNIHGKVTAAADTTAAGKVASEFTLSGGVLSGIVTCNNKDGLDKLRKAENILRDNLANTLRGPKKEAEIRIGTINYVQSVNADWQHFSGIDIPRDVNGPEEQLTPSSTQDLYLTAKTFIGYLQKCLS